MAMLLFAGMCIGAALAVGLLRTKSAPKTVASGSGNIPASESAPGGDSQVSQAHPGAARGKPQNPVQSDNSGVVFAGSGMAGDVRASVPGQNPRSKSSVAGTGIAGNQDSAVNNGASIGSTLSSPAGMVGASGSTPSSGSVGGGGNGGNGGTSSGADSSSSGNTAANSTAGNSKEAPKPVELNIDVPFGAVVPAAVVDNAENRSPQQQAVLNKILTDFQSDVAAPASGSQSRLDTWNQARSRADEQYRVIFGDAAYNQMTMKAALDALPEKKAVATPAQQ